ncbi:hypothetical protein [Bacillus sp. FJAT-27445]|uniref:hypothetical protein n=1 Tax=Bacillus sp. FJAT-27445 TaxID=1679166 RepID=UPI000A507EBC|nr:hypothetical protein [Bacillus sp. FJAT-27445]
MEKKNNNGDKPTLAPGLNTDENLSKSATEKDKREGNVTQVTIASYDEVDPS